MIDINLETATQWINDAIRIRSLFNIACLDDHRKWSSIRSIYKLIDTDVYTPYPVSWTRIFTPIEDMTWGEIRGVGLPFYPQFPIGKFFADFADPITRIAIECDGKDYHSAEKDARRDFFIKSQGWRVFRISGADCVRKIQSPWDVLLNSEISIDDPCVVGLADWWAHKTVDGLIWAISVSFYGHKTSNALLELANQVLVKRSGEQI